MVETLNCSSSHPTMFSSGEEASIPVVDFDLLVNGTANQRPQVIRDVGRACKDWGFFMVINHGVPEALKEGVMKACDELLSLQEEEKAEYLEAAPMDPVQIGTGYYSAVGQARHLRHYLKMFVHPEFHCPPKPEQLRDLAADFTTQTRYLMLQLAKAISESLGLDGGRIPEALNLDSGIQMLAQNHYPAYASSDSDSDGMATALPPHTDPGVFALIFQNGVDGLQVQHNGQWILARPLPGAFFFLIGDQIEIATNERYKAVVHRAVVGSDKARTSVVSMLAPCLDAVVEPVQELATSSHCRPGFRAMKFRDYIIAHQQSNRANGQTAMGIVTPHDGTTVCTE